MIFKFTLLAGAPDPADLKRWSGAASWIAQTDGRASETFVQAPTFHNPDGSLTFRDLRLRS